MSATAWIPNYDSTLYFDPTAVSTTTSIGQGEIDPPFPPPSAAKAPSPKKQKGRVSPTSSGTAVRGKGKSPENARGRGFSINFAKQTKSSRKRFEAEEGSSSYQGTAFGSAPPVTKPVVDLSSSERPWEPSNPVESHAFMGKSMKHPVGRLSLSPKSNFSFGSSTPRDSVLGLASSRGGGAVLHQTANSYASRAPNPGGNPDGITHNRHRSHTHHESRFFFASKKNSSPGRLDNSSQFQGSYGGNPSDLFVADFEAVKRSRAQMQKQKEREMMVKEQREKVNG